MRNAQIYLAECPVCVNAERTAAECLDRNRFKVEIIHLGEHEGRIAEARRAGVKSVPPR
ncbi:MAG TPA: hypothetical protein PLD59_14775 [Tepidisphaeraceae bacterium]|nr:hypothetical protein [Tepidisphaeraceae bacterium]